VKDALDGTWKKDSAWWGVKEGSIDLVSISDKVPAETKAEVEKLKAGLKDGSFHPWTGPIADQAGKELLPAGQKADDGFLHKVDFYVKGVEGKVPGK
jgi:simple sugar transport system substrate-binding protein